jgi:ribosomal protein S12 methylthiotransferase
LRKMGRPTTQYQIRALIEKIRNTIPEVTLRTSLIVGFPGETERHFNALMQFVEQTEFDHLGVFAYSAEEGTKAADMRDHVPESVKEERMDQIAQLHERIAAKKRQRLIGRQEIVLVDSPRERGHPCPHDRAGSQELATESHRKNTEKNWEAIGRTQGQAPEIDDAVYIVNGEMSDFYTLPWRNRELAPVSGEFVKVEIIGTYGPYDLIGQRLR